MEKKVEEMVGENKYIKTEDNNIYEIRLKNFYRIVNNEDYIKCIISVLNNNELYNNYKIAYILYKTYNYIMYYETFEYIIKKMNTEIDLSGIRCIKEKYDFIDKINMNYINENFSIEDYQNCILIFFDRKYNNDSIEFEEIIIKYMIINNKIMSNENYYKKYKIRYIKLKEINKIWNLKV